MLEWGGVCVTVSTRVRVSRRGYREEDGTRTAHCCSSRTCASHTQYLHTSARAGGAITAVPYKWWMHGCIYDGCMHVIHGGWMDDPWIDLRMNACLVDVCIVDGCVDNRCMYVY